MRVIEARNAQLALPEGLKLLQAHGERRESRAGDVLVHPGPVTTLYQRPRERVMFWPERDANPFFHFYESLWMLAGRNDLAPLSRIVKRMETFSDDGETLHGAYGHRWRVHFGFDQLGHIIQALKDNPEDRRNVLQMWDANVDLGRDGRDVPCNTQVYFSRDGGGALDMTVCCRSNDIIWGAYGANVVHFSMLQEYMAAGIGCEVGRYWQISNNYHAYLETFEPLRGLIDKAQDPFRGTVHCPYSAEEVRLYPLVQTPIENWQRDLQMFMKQGMTLGIRDPFFRKVAAPLMAGYDVYKGVGGPGGVERYENAIETVGLCEATDWSTAAAQWLGRRLENYRRRMDDGVNYD